MSLQKILWRNCDAMKADTMASKDRWKWSDTGTSGWSEVQLWTYELYLSNVAHGHLKMAKVWNRMNCQHHTKAHFMQCNMQHTVLQGFLEVCTEIIKECNWKWILIISLVPSWLQLFKCVPSNRAQQNGAHIQSNGGQFLHIFKKCVNVSCSMRHNVLYRGQHN
jgi:hypothetical protein